MFCENERVCQARGGQWIEIDLVLAGARLVMQGTDDDAVGPQSIGRPTDDLHAVAFGLAEVRARVDRLSGLIEQVEFQLRTCRVLASEIAEILDDQLEGGTRVARPGTTILSENRANGSTKTAAEIDESIGVGAQAHIRLDKARPTLER